jgi:hypothetical protein
MSVTFAELADAIELGADQLRELTAAGVEMGFRSVFHACLGKITDPATLRREIQDSRWLLESFGS